ncbi:MAG: ThuA domain-containing protein [Saprospiraceae bacterium]
MQKILIISLILFYTTILAGSSFSQKKVLLYTKNGKGYVHDNIPNAISMFDSLSKMMHFQLTVSEDPIIFNEIFLKQIDLIIFSSTNNDVFDTDIQRLEFRHYIEAGGKFFGIHSAVGTERNWTWFKQMLGCTFAWHPPFQAFDVIKLAPNHASLKSIPMRWERKDECYFLKELFPGVQPILAVDLLSLKADSTNLSKVAINKGTYGQYYPIAWEQDFDGGHILISTLGHDKNDYKSGAYVDYLKQSITYLLSYNKLKNYQKVHSISKDDPAINLK